MEVYAVIWEEFYRKQDQIFAITNPKSHDAKFVSNQSLTP